MNQIVRRLIQQSEQLSYGAQRLAMAEEAVREADALGDDELSYDARIALTDAANFGGAPEKLLVAFSWCLARFDSNPDDYAEWTLLWRYKWIVTAIANFPQISREQISEMLDDIESRFQAAGYSLRVVDQKRMENAIVMGDLDTAMSAYETMNTKPRDFMSDCHACECSAQVELLTAHGDSDEAIKVGQPVFSKQLTCEVVPHLTFGYVLPALLKQGRSEDASDYHKRGYALVSRQPKRFLRPISEHLLYFACTGDFAKGIRCFERALPAAIDNGSVLARYRILVSSSLLFGALAEQRPRERKVRLPPEHPLRREDDKIAPGEIAQWLAGEAERIAKQFDQRNGNAYFSDQLSQLRQLVMPG